METVYLCPDWGDPRQLKFCSTPREERDGYGEDGHRLRLALLAGVWADGFVRVLDLRVDRRAEGDLETKYCTFYPIEFNLAGPFKLRVSFHISCQGSNISTDAIIPDQVYFASCHD